MRIVYDISVLGEQYSAIAVHNGVYRVIDALARSLSKSPQCSLTFSSAEGTSRYGAADYFQKETAFARAHFPNARIHGKFRNRISALQERVNYSSGLRKVWWRAARKVACQYQVMPFVPRLDGLDEKSLSEADVFHSPYYSLPAKVRDYGRVCKFLTVYDLIPVCHPEFFVNPTGRDHDVKRALDGLQAEDWVLCISQSTKDDLCAYRPDLDPARMVVTHLAASGSFTPCVDEAKIASARGKYGIPKGRYLLSLCTLEPRKNLVHLIRCFRDLICQDGLEDLQLVLAGGLGWKYEALLAEVETNLRELRKRVVLVGRVAEEDLSAVYSGATAFVYPSLYEGFGLPPLEAMQCGVPVITSNNSSLPEVVGDAGVMVDPRDSDALSQAMLNLCADGQLRASLAARALKRARQFSWERCTTETLTAYKAAVLQRGA